MRATSSGGAGGVPRRAGASGSSSPTPSTRTPPSGSKKSPARISRRDSRTSSGERDGASTTIRCPRAASSRESERTKSLTSCSSSHGWGVTCAMAKGSLTSAQDMGYAETCSSEAPFAFRLAGLPWRPRRDARASR